MNESMQPVIAIADAPDDGGTAMMINTRTGSAGTRLLTSKEVAGILAVTEPTLARWRADGRGPTWVELGHRVPRYLASDVDAWISAQRRGDVA